MPQQMWESPPPTRSAPKTHVSMLPVSQTVSQAPQCSSLFATQWLSQQISPSDDSEPGVQTSVPQRHMLSEQVEPAPHAVPQPPQFASSALVLMHEPPQQVVPSAHAMPLVPHVQVPAVQSSSAPQA